MKKLKDIWSKTFDILLPIGIVIGSLCGLLIFWGAIFAVPVITFTIAIVLTLRALGVIP